MPAEAFEGWAIVELMGHRRLGGLVREETRFGAAMLRIDVPSSDGERMATQWYGGGAIYCVTPTTEAIARAIAKGAQPTPVNAWELPQLPPKRTEGEDGLDTCEACDGILHVDDPTVVQDPLNACYFHAKCAPAPEEHPSVSSSVTDERPF